jgi:uncharacterized protein
MTETSFAPVARADRIDVLDILRGIAILGIFYMNIPFMGASESLASNDIRSIGWSVADRNTWAVIQIVLEGTQRGLLEILFGAGMMVLARRAMEPDGPVAVADLYYRRNLWLIAFGLFDVFILLWPGDILHIYGLAALFLFPFRRLSPKWLVAIGSAFALFTAVQGGMEYASRTTLMHQAEAVAAKQASGKPLAKADKDIQAEWQKKLDRLKLDKDEKKKFEEEQAARTPSASFMSYAGFLWNAWLGFVGEGSIWYSVPEAFCAMLIGVALWKWRIIQGGRSARFYLVLMLAAYGYGMTARAVGVSEIFTFSPIPKTVWINWEFARLAVAIGHIALVNLMVKSVLGARILSPLKAAGRTAFSLYFMQQIIGLYILFAPFGFGLWGKFGWAGLEGIATAVIVSQIVVANIWVRFFATGPFEWAWRSLSYLKWQPFRLRTASAVTEEPATA